MAISVSAKRHWWNRVGATETDTGTAARVDAAVVVRGLVAACAFGAAAIHFGFAPDHFGESRFHGAFPDCTFEWTAERGADELATAYAAVGLTADELSGERYLRLGRLKHLLADGELGDGLRWTSPAGG